MQIHLFQSSSTKRMEQLNEKQKNVILSLKGKILNEVPIIGSFCKKRCFLDEVIFDLMYIEYNLCFLKESFIYEEGLPKKVISKESVNCKLYYSKEIMIIVLDDDNLMKSALGIVLNMLNYINLKTVSEFSYTQYRYEEMFINIDELKLIQDILNERLYVRYENINHKRVLMIDMTTYDANDNEKAYDLKTLPIKGKKKAFEFYYFNDERKKVKLIFNVNAIIYSDIMVNKRTIDELISLIYIVLKKKNPKEFLVSINKTMEEYCSFIHKDMLLEAKVRQKNLIVNELLKLIKSELEINNSNSKVNEIYITIILNILLKLVLSEKNEFIKAPLKNEINIEEYENLIIFLKKYTLKKYSKSIDEDKIIRYLEGLGNIIKLSKGIPETLIDIYKTN